jgi:hypothetical protein
MGRAAENKSSVISFQLSVTRAGKAIADGGQLIPNPRPRAPIPQPFPRYPLSIAARAAGEGWWARDVEVEVRAFFLICCKLLKVLVRKGKGPEGRSRLAG